MNNIELVQSVIINGKSHHIRYKRSEEIDTWKIERLIYNHFGERKQFNVLDDIDLRYLCAFDEERLIGITGIHKSYKYKGYEIEYTCLEEAYRGFGIITAMINSEIQRTRIGDPSANIFCSCWAVKDSKIHLNNAMKMLNFERLQLVTEFNSEYERFCEKYCIRYSEGCTCKEVVYIQRP